MPADQRAWPRLTSPALTAPFRPRPGAVVDEDAASPVDLSRLSLLVVEDDEGDAVYLEVCLEEAGVPASAVRWCATLTAAAQLLSESPVDCVLTDLGLPDASGLQAVHDLVALSGSAAVIVLTGLHDQRGEAALGAGAQDYLVKDGLSGELLGRCVRYALERKRVERATRRLEEADLRAAENARLERGLLPRPVLTSGSVVSATHYRPGAGNAVLGGDFYDIVERPDGSVRVVIGDVMGHGTDEAAIGVHLRVAWRALVLAGLPDEEVLPSLQTFLLAEALPIGMFVTACDLTIAGGLVTARSAGHPPPILDSDEGLRYLDVRPDVPLGLAHRDWTSADEPLSGAWKILMFTDGLLDAFRDDDDPADIGDGHLLAAAGLASDPVPQRWIDGVLERAATSVSDDLALVALARRGP